MERTREARTFAERALALFVLHLGEHRDEITVIGGLNADLLTVPTPVPHQGTVDIDVFVQVGVVYDRDDMDFGWLERTLGAADFTTRTDQDTWRWYREVDGVTVRLELLWDVLDSPGQQIVLPGTDDVAAMNLAGPSAAAGNSVTRALEVHPDDAARSQAPPVETVSARFVDLGGYLLAKAAAAKALLDAAGRHGGATVDHAASVRSALEALADADGPAPLAYAEQRVRDGVEEDIDVLVQDAVGAALDCRAAFERPTSPGAGTGNLSA